MLDVEELELIMDDFIEIMNGYKPIRFETGFKYRDERITQDNDRRSVSTFDHVIISPEKKSGEIYYKAVSYSSKKSIESTDLLYVFDSIMYEVFSPLISSWESKAGDKILLENIQYLDYEPDSTAELADEEVFLHLLLCHIMPSLERNMYFKDRKKSYYPFCMVAGNDHEKKLPYIGEMTIWNYHPEISKKEK